MDLSGDDLVVSTDCDFISRQGDHLTGIGSAYVAARDIDLGGDVVASGLVVLRAARLAISRTSGSLCSAAALSVEAPEVDLRADNDLTALCAEGGSVISRQASNTISGGGVYLAGDTVDIHGDFTNVSSFVGSAQSDLILRQASTLEAANVFLQAGGALDLHGDIVASGPVSVAGGPLTFRQASQIAGATTVEFNAFGPELLDWHGKVLTSNALTVTSTTGLIFRQSARIENNGDVSIDVPDLEGRGMIRYNGQVSIQTDTYELFTSHDFRFNVGCSITDTPAPGSKTPKGCP